MENPERVNGIPPSEIRWVHIFTEKNEYYVTSKESRGNYFLYQVRDGKAEKIGKSKSPADLEERCV